jgi:hypothetical protein
LWHLRYANISHSMQTCLGGTPLWSNEFCFCPFCINLTSFPTFLTLQDKHNIRTLSLNIKFICTRCETGLKSSPKARYSACFYVTLVPVSYLSAPSTVHSYKVPGKFIRRLKSLFVGWKVYSSSTNKAKNYSYSIFVQQMYWLQDKIWYTARDNIKTGTNITRTTKKTPLTTFMKDEVWRLFLSFLFKSDKFSDFFDIAG